MIENDGVVVRLEGDYAWVRAEGAGHACGACARKDGCNRADAGSLLDGAPAQSARLLRLANTIQARPGDAVVISAADGIVLRAVWLAYGIPLLMSLAGAMGASALTGNEVAPVAGMLFGLFAGYLITRRRGLSSSQAEPILSISFKRSPLSLHEG